MKVVLLPFPAFGHMIPFYQLGVVLAKSGVHVSFISTPRNIERLPKVPLNLLPFFTFVPIPFPKDSPLPEGHEATIDILPEAMNDLFVAWDLLQQPIKQFVAEVSPDWLIVDFFHHWAADIATECGAFLLLFSVLSAAALTYIGPHHYFRDSDLTRMRSSPENLTSPPPWITFPSKVAYRRFEAIPFFSRLEGNSEFERLAKIHQGSKAVLVRTCREIEGEYLNLFSEILGKPVIPLGFLLPDQTEKRASLDENWVRTLGWLDQQTPKSVVFVGFGSECKLAKEQIHEIAGGLEESELPFLWSLRRPVWAAEDNDTLPSGFLDRTDRKGKVCFGWAPQLEILAHPAVRVFLFHSGWGSIIEAMQFGHALVVLPMVFDQGLNARLMVEKGLAIEVERDEDDGSFQGKDVAKCLKQAMATKVESESGFGVREAAAAAKDTRLHDRYTDGLIKYLLENMAH